MNYPTLNVKNMKAMLSVLEQAATDPTYLNPENCPYDPGTVKLLRDFLDQYATQVSDSGDVDTDRAKVGRPSKKVAIPMDEVEKEIDEIRKELATLKIEGQTMETSDRIQVIKTRAALIERVLGMKERVADVKRFHAFVTTVIGIMEDHLDPKEREKVLKELKQYVEI